MAAERKLPVGLRPSVGLFNNAFAAVQALKGYIGRRIASHWYF
jgi:hypothetical protein